MKDAVNILRDARKLIAKPGTWVKHRLAYTSYQFAVCDVDDLFSQKRMSCYCAMGAIHRAGGYGGWHKVSSVVTQVLDERVPTGSSLAEFNDAPETKQVDVLAFFDRCIDIAEVFQ